MSAAVIGCGMIAGTFEDLASDGVYSHGKAYRRAGFAPIGFLDADPARARALATKFGGVAHESLDALLGAKPSVVSVCTPDATHAELIRQLSEHSARPKLIFAEKPVCRTSAELAALIEVEKRSGVPVIVNHSRRFDASHRKLRALVADGSLGELLQADVDYYGGWQHVGVHAVDLLHFLTGATLEIRAARLQSESRHAGDPTLDVDANLGRARVRFAGFDERNFQVFEFKLKFERGMIVLNDFGSEIRVFRKFVNAARENVLVEDSAFSGQGLKSPILGAMDLISGYLQSGDRKPLALYGLSEASRTMSALWAASDLIGVSA